MFIQSDQFTLENKMNDISPW